MSITEAVLTTLGGLAASLIIDMTAIRQFLFITMLLLVFSVIGAIFVLPSLYIIIGKEGKMRRFIEDTLGVNISVYGKTVAIIGDAESVAVAREAILMLVEGAQHSTVQRFLERKRREMKMRSLDWF
jgi:phosphopantetheinyl transferase